MKTIQLQFNEWIIVPVVAVFVVSMGIFMSQMKTHSSKEISEIKYQMPRPQDEFVGDYSLDGRQVNRKYINPFAKKSMVKTIPDAKNQGPKSEQKKSQSKQVKANKAKGLLNDKKFDVEIVEQTQNQMLNDISVNNLPKKQNQQNIAQLQNKKTQDKASMATKSVAQWMELLNKNPNAENIVLLVKSYRAKNIDAAQFYQIANTLLSSSESNKVQAGLYALQLQPETQAFQFVSHKLAMIETPSDLSNALEQYLVSFNEAQKLPILVQVLKTNDQIAMTKAIEVLSQFNEKVTLQGRFQYRGSNVNQQQYVQLISYFKSLLNNENEAVVSTAQNMLTKLQALVESATIGT